MAPALRRTRRRPLVAKRIVGVDLAARAFETLNELVAATGLNASQMVTLIVQTAVRALRVGQETRLVLALQAAASSTPELGAKSVKTSFNLTESTLAALQELADVFGLSRGVTLGVMLDAIAAAYGGGGGGQKPRGDGDMDLGALVNIISTVPPSPSPRGSEPGDAEVGKGGELTAA